jgi:hypothetical protein
MGSKVHKLRAMLFLDIKLVDYSISIEVREKCPNGLAGI